MKDLAKKISMLDGKVYIVSEIGFEYDDNHYYIPESGGMNPRKAFASKEKAEAYIEQQNFERFKALWDGCYFKDYQCNMFDDSNSKFKELCKEFEVDQGLFESYGNEDLPELEDKDLLKFFKLFELKFFEMSEIEIS
jgi:hypothetical protein